jgi:hypothetical protein
MRVYSQRQVGFGVPTPYIDKTWHFNISISCGFVASICVEEMNLLDKSKELPLGQSEPASFVLELESLLCCHKSSTQCNCRKNDLTSPGVSGLLGQMDSALDNVSRQRKYMAP